MRSRLEPHSKGPPQPFLQILGCPEETFGGQTLQLIFALSLVTKKKLVEIYTRSYSLFETLHFVCKLLMAQYVRVLQNTRLERLVGVKHSGLLVPFISYKENEVLRIQLLLPYKLRVGRIN